MSESETTPDPLLLEAIEALEFYSNPAKVVSFMGSVIEGFRTDGNAEFGIPLGTRAQSVLKKWKDRQ